MNKVMFVVIAIVAIAVLAIGITLVSGTEYWETPADFGNWQEEITIGFTDGTEKSLKIMQDNEGSWVPLRVTYNNEEISWIAYSISAEVTDFGGYDSVKLDPGGIGLRCKIIKSGVSIWSDPVAGGGIITITPNTIKNVLLYKLYSTTIENEATRDGTYGIGYTPSGNCQYWGYPDGTKSYVSLPGGKTVHVEVTSGSGNGGGQIVITLSGNVGTA